MTMMLKPRAHLYTEGTTTLFLAARAQTKVSIVQPNCEAPYDAVNSSNNDAWIIMGRLFWPWDPIDKLD